MPILEIAVVIIVAGVALWIVNRYIPMQAGVKNLLNIFVVGALAVWILLMVFHRFGAGPNL